MKRLTKKFCLVTLAFILVYLFTLVRNNFVIDVSELSFTRAQTCPACFGISLCSHYQYHQLKLIGWTQFTILRFLNGKNVFYGQLGFEQAVVKMLAHDYELELVDKSLCEKVSIATNPCNVTEAVRRLSEKLIKTDRAQIAGEAKQMFGTDLFRCPSARLLDLMYKRSVSEAGLSVPLSSTYEKQTIVFTALTNPEPLILQMFPASEGWPFPRLLGACGRTVVVEHGGQMLSEFEDSTWRTRVEIAVQMLKMAQQLTENALDYALYMTDVNMHNFAVDKDGVLRLIDVESIIVVDKQKVRKDKPEGWDSPYINYGIGCHDCLSFSADDLCSHELSDHNYYAVCRGILAPKAYYCRQGFLHGIPQGRDGMLLHDLLEKCARPGSDLERLEVVPRLIEILEELVY